MNKVLVVGGGIGGLATAIAMRRAGVDVDIIEINPEWSVYGVGIIQPGNCLRALDELGLAQEVIDSGFPFDGDRFHDKDGNLIAANEYPRVAGEQYPAMNGITRARLHEILTSAVRRLGANVRLGLTVDELADSGDDVAVTFSDGTLGVYDLVVGADGINSLVRQLVFAPDLTPTYTGQVCWRYNVPRPPEVDRIWMFAGTGGKAGIVPLAPDLAYVLLIEAPPNGEERVPEERLAEVFRARLDEFGGVIGEMRDRHITDSARVVLRAVHAVLAPQPWHRGRIALIGDAAHATSPHLGQGAAMAIEDGIVLTQEVLSDKPLEDALAAFEERRYPRCKFIYDGSLTIGRWELEHAHDADFAGLTARSVVTMAAPI